MTGIWQLFRVILMALVLSGAVPFVLSAQDRTALANGTDAADAPLGLERRAGLVVRQVPLAEALTRLYETSGVPVSFSPSLLPRESIVSCVCEELTVAKTLDRLLQNTNLRYREIDGHVLVYHNDAMRLRPRLDHTSMARYALVAMNFVPILSRGAGPSAAQEAGAIVGRVTEAGTDIPIVNAQVSVDGEGRAVTDDDGRFRIANVPAGRRTVSVSSVGYQSATSAVDVADGATVTVDFSLESEAIELKEIVAVGYGAQRREEITGAVASVSSDQFVKGPARDLASLIAGKLAGVAVNTPSGDPTEGTQVQLRGTTTLQGPADPLVLVDGVPGTLNTVPSEDIESISVLKDGSAAAVYGSRASNGVILITTKRHSGGGPTFRYDGYISQQRIYNTPDMLTAADQRRLIGEGYEFTDLGSDTNWRSQVLRNSMSHRHNLTVSGGAANTNYAASLNFESTEGIFKRSDNREVSARANIRHSMFDGRLQLEANLISRTQSNFDGPDFEFVWRQSLIRNPTDRVVDGEGNWQETSVGALNYYNPLALIEEENGEAETRLQRMHATVMFRPIDQLRFSLMGGTSRENELTGSATTFKHQSNTQDRSGGTASRSTRSGVDRILEATGTYARSIGNHSFNVLGGYSYQDFESETFASGNSRFPSDVFGYDQLQQGSGLAEGIASMSSGFSDSKLVGFFGRLNYDWNNRYLLMASVRHEGNSRFGADHKWGWFPAISAGWRISEEGFMSGLSFIDDLRLRIGYGVTGIAPDESYLSLTSYEYGPRILYDGEWVQGLAPTRNPNPNLRWEEKHELNVGLNFSLFDFRLSGALDVYRRDTRDMLFNYSVPVPPNLYNTILANVGDMRNNGIELELSYDVINRPGLSWTTSANWSYNTNKLKSLSNDAYQTDDFFYTGGTGEPIQQTTHRVRVGEPIGNFYGFKSVDIDEDGVWVVLNKEGEEISIRDVTESDRHILGNGFPKQYFAWNNTARLGSFDLSVNLRGAADFQILNGLRMFYENPTILHFNMLRSAFDPVYGKRPVNYDGAYVSYYIEDGDYIKLDNATLGYTFSSGMLGLLSGVLSDARVYVSGRNLLTITGYSGLDPEVATTGLAPGIESRDAYPTTRTFTLGMSFVF